MNKETEALTPVCVPKRIVRNWAASVMRHCDYCSHYKDTVLNDDGSAICASCCDSEHSGNLQCALEEALQRNGVLIAALEQARTEREEFRKRLKLERQIVEDADKRIAELESSLSGMMQLSNELAEMKRKCAELELKLANPVLLPKTNGYWTEQEKAYEDAITLAKRQVRLAGFRCEGDE